MPADGHTPAATGLLSLGQSVGPMARHVKDLELLFNVISDAPQFENKDDASSSQLSIASLAGMRAAFFTGDNTVPVTEETREAVEAAAKALGTGFRRGVFFADLGVVNLPGGQPTLELTGGSAERLFPQDCAGRYWRVETARVLSAAST